MSVRIRVRAWVALLGALMMAACVSLPQGETPPQRYVLTPLPATEGDELAGRIEVAAPRVPAALASDRIAVVRQGRRLDHYAGARWGAPLPELLKDFLATSVENRLGPVAWDGGPARYRLVTAVRDFQAEYPQGAEDRPRVRVTLVAVLWDRARGEVVLRQRHAADRRVAANRLAAVTAALEGLLQALTGQVLEGARTRLAARGQGG